MICQFCGKNKATNKYHVNVMGIDKEIFLCDDCIKGINANSGLPEEQKIELGSESTISVSSEELKTKRKLNQLQWKLSNAVTDERYEDAADLRDQIKVLEKEVYVNGK